ncbi:unnamed protein product [Chondrus crispus]|uniref:Uncharacterized protein n=1 Tax=Chondrus crispus TaxID=2769 RepID=R7QJJ2_CHOCR|nr:unnamed protein product [Chondrus crispus]CDF37570.1 unnamed protein product [Chondrus crispus]|eukprot:XP_005717441.1 unnamed protein product [Chondrus crispus]
MRRRARGGHHAGQDICVAPCGCAAETAKKPCTPNWRSRRAHDTRGRKAERHTGQAGRPSDAKGLACGEPQYGYWPFRHRERLWRNQLKRATRTAAWGCRLIFRRGGKFFFVRPRRGCCVWPRREARLRITFVTTQRALRTVVKLYRNAGLMRPFCATTASSICTLRQSH